MGRETGARSSRIRGIQCPAATATGAGPTDFARYSSCAFTAAGSRTTASPFLIPCLIMPGCGRTTCSPFLPLIEITRAPNLLCLRYLPRMYASVDCRGLDSNERSGYLARRLSRHMHVSSSVRTAVGTGTRLVFPSRTGIARRLRGSRRRSGRGRRPATDLRPAAGSHRCRYSRVRKPVDRGSAREGCPRE